MADLDRLLSQYEPPRRGDAFLFGGLGLDEYPGPQRPVKSDDYMVERPERRPDVLSQGMDSILPSHDFWNSYVTENPSVHDRIGRMQAAGLAALNSLGFGLPMALAQRYAPEGARRAQAVMDAFPSERNVASIGAAVANPANVGLRAAGNALAARGYNIGTQAAADGATAFGTAVLPDVIRTGGLPSHADIPASTAMAARVMMPTLPSSLIERTLRGAQAGALSQLPAAATGDMNRVAVGGVYGAGYGAGSKASSREPTLSKEAQAAIRERYFDMLANVAGIPAALVGAHVMLTGNKSNDDERPPIGDPQYPHLDRMLSQYRGN